MFGTCVGDREWVEVFPKPFDVYVMCHGARATPRIVGLPKSPGIIEPAYDDTPIPLKRSRAVGQQFRYGFPITLSPIQTASHTPQSRLKVTGAGTFQSHLSVPYRQRFFRTPDWSKYDDQQRAFVHQPSLRLWTIDVSVRFAHLTV